MKRSIALDGTKGKKLAGLLHRGEAYAIVQANPRRFLKDLVSVGTWTHPLTEEILNFDRARLERLAELSNKWIAAGHKIPFTSGHDTSIEAALGFVIGPFSVTHDDKLVAVIEAVKDDAVEGIVDGTLDAVSVAIDFDIIESDSGVTFPEVITHVAATNFPVLTGQDAFKALSRKLGSQSGRSMYLSGVPKAEGGSMDLKMMALLLGLPEGSDEKTVKTALEGKLKEAKEAGTASTAAAAAAKESLDAIGKALGGHGLKLDGSKVVKVPITDPKTDDDPEKVEMRKRMAALEFSGLKDRLTMAIRIADQAVKDGKIPPALRDTALAILSGTRAIESLSLDATGEKVEKVALDLLSETQKLLNGLPSQTDPRTGLSTLSGTGGEAGKTEAEKKKEELSSKGSAVAKRLQAESAAT